MLEICNSVVESLLERGPTSFGVGGAISARLNARLSAWLPTRLSDSDRSRTTLLCEGKNMQQHPTINPCDGPNSITEKRRAVDIMSGRYIYQMKLSPMLEAEY